MGKACLPNALDTFDTACLLVCRFMRALLLCLQQRMPSLSAAELGVIAESLPAWGYIPEATFMQALQQAFLQQCTASDMSYHNLAKVSAAGGQGVLGAS